MKSSPLKVHFLRVPSGGIEIAVLVQDIKAMQRTRNEIGTKILIHQNFILRMKDLQMNIL